MGNIASNQNPVVSDPAQTPPKKHQASQDDVCAICMDDAASGDVTLECGHQFHTACVKTWMHQRQTCPICRRRDTITFPLQTPTICTNYYDLNATIAAAMTQAITDLSNNGVHLGIGPIDYNVLIQHMMMS